jgi:DNA-binding response OmpR family regulator
MTAKKIAILCVDDDPFYTGLYRQILEPKGYAVATAGNPDEGYAQVKKRLPDVMLLDVMMPEKKIFKDGYGLLQRLREETATKSLPIIMISALGNEDDVKHGLKLGATSFLPKQEMMPDRLLAEIVKALGTK